MEEIEQDDYDDNGQMPGGDYDALDAIDHEILETLMILGLTVALAGLLYYRVQRQRRLEEERRRQQAQPAAAPQQPPQPQPPVQNPFQPDPADWAAGGFGL